MGYTLKVSLLRYLFSVKGKNNTSDFRAISSHFLSIPIGERSGILRNKVPVIYAAVGRSGKETALSHPCPHK